MFRVFNCFATEHDWRLVVLAGLLCFLASLSAVSLIYRARATLGPMRWAWILTAGTTTGCGIWATHFVAMLAYEPGFAVAYNIRLTILSLLAAIGLTSVGLAAALIGKSRWSAPAGGAIVGGGIACMHYVGMWALELPAHVIWGLDLVVVSIVMGLVFGAAATTVAMRRQNVRASLTAAVLLTLAIVSHHFIAMGAIGFIPDPLHEVEAATLSPAALALAIAGAAVAVLGLSLMGALAHGRIARKTREFGAAVGQLTQARQELIKDTEAKLRDHNMRLDAAINNMSQGLCMFGADGRLVVANARYAEMYGLTGEIVKPGVTPQELLRHRIALGTYSGDAEQYLAELRTMLAKGKTTSTLVDLNDGRAIAVVNQPMPGGGWVATHEDVTEQRRAEQSNASHT